MFWRPWLVLVQGVGFNAAVWDPVCAAFAASFNWWS
jgi:hypothetical protein